MKRTAEQDKHNPPPDDRQPTLQDALKACSCVPRVYKDGRSWREVHEPWCTLPREQHERVY